MPVSELQGRILREIAANRSPESYVAGATVLHRAESSPRFSEDLDLFHDIADAVAVSAEADAQTLRKAGYPLTWVLQTPTFYRAVAEVAGQSLKLEWAHDSAFRFFPVESDELCGYRLHSVDAAVNKVLAMAGRMEVRDFVDVLHVDAECLRLGTLAWAACGKDPGFTPDFLLEQANAHTAYRAADLARLHLRAPLELPRLKRQWLEAIDRARGLVNRLPDQDLGCLYLDADGSPVNPEPSSGRIGALRRHFGSVGGAWPAVTDAPRG